MTLIHPSYDAMFYRARAERYHHAAELEPDATIRLMLKGVAAACRQKAARLEALATRESADAAAEMISGLPTSMRTVEECHTSGTTGGNVTIEERERVRQR